MELLEAAGLDPEPLPVSRRQLLPVELLEAAGGPLLPKWQWPLPVELLEEARPLPRGRQRPLPVQQVEAAGWALHEQRPLPV